MLKNLNESEEVKNETDVFNNQSDGLNDRLDVYEKSGGLDDDEEDVYSFGLPVMMTVCVAAVAMNVRCLAAVRWVRGPLSPTLRLSISLAAADLEVSLLTLLSFVINSSLQRTWLKNQYRPTSVMSCTLSVMEAFRLAGIVSVVAHLAALAFNHLFGVTRPLRYPSVATSQNVKTVIIFLWIGPLVLFLLLWGPLAPEGQALRAFHEGCLQSFLVDVRWRGAFVGTVLAIPLVAMSAVYAHVLHVLHRRTTAWSRRDGSRRTRGGGSRIVEDPQRRVQVSTRAVYTTLQILGSFVALYLPASLSYLLVCTGGCVWKQWSGKILWVNWTAQTLLVAKPLVNPLIYASRMFELRDATRRMYAAAASGWLCSKCRRLLDQPERPERITVCRLASDGSGQPRTTFVNINDTTLV